LGSVIPTIHEYLDSLQETGKILSLQTTFDLLNSFKDPKDIDRFYMGVLHEKIPDNLKELLLSPYISKDGNEIRFSVRVYESHKGMNRQDMIESIRNHLTQTIGLLGEQVQLTGMVVLYNNVLQSLFTSQILTIGFVFITMFLMFLVLFRNLWIAMVAIIPNIFITFFVLGVMGWSNIPLDIMTITIAAICFGISDDDTIHYIHRFTEEFHKTRNYKKSIERSHNTIGRAMYYTSIIIVFGFFMLVFSNFVPTIYFGLLICLSMIVALIADLTLLPALLYIFKPFGKETTKY
jgi:predicted RND superfamily exporter protein